MGHIKPKGSLDCPQVHPLSNQLAHLLSRHAGPFGQRNVCRYLYSPTCREAQCRNRRTLQLCRMKPSCPQPGEELGAGAAHLGPAQCCYAPRHLTFSSAADILASSSLCNRHRCLSFWPWHTHSICCVTGCVTPRGNTLQLEHFLFLTGLQTEGAKEQQITHSRFLSPQDIPLKAQ